MSRPSRRDRSRATPVGGAATAVASAWSGPPTQAGPQLDRFRALLASGEPVLADGAMGTMLFAAGLASGDPPEVWNLAHPDVVRGVHRGYLDAGARILLTNTFGANRLRLALHRLEDRVEHLNRTAAILLRAEVTASGADALVAGDIGPVSGGDDVIGLVANSDLWVAEYAPPQLTWTASVLVQTNTWHSASGYHGSGSWMHFTGSSATKTGGSFDEYQTRVYGYDPNLQFLPPPWFPAVDDSFTTTFFREVAP